MVEYSSEIKPTKFENADEFATFLSESYWWDREWAGIDYDHKECAIMLNKLWEAHQENKRKNHGHGQAKLMATFVKPFWDEQLKKYSFPLYFRRDCVYADGRSTEYLCQFLTKEQYNDYYKALASALERRAKTLTDMLEN